MNSKKELVSKVLVIFVMCAFMASGAVFAASSSRIIPSGKVTMYDGDKAIGEYSEEAPLPEDVTLVCSGNCAIETKGLRMVAEDGTKFSVGTANGSKVLQVKEGTLFFALAEMPRPIVFATPFGAYTAQQVMITTSAKSGLLQGYLKVGEENGELGVHGGSMVVSSAGGERTIPDGQAMLLALSDPNNQDGGNSNNPDKNSSKNNLKKAGVIIGTMAGGIGAGIAADTDGGSGNGSGSVSPSAP